MDVQKCWIAHIGMLFFIDRKNGKTVYNTDIISKEICCVISEKDCKISSVNAIGKDETEYCLSWKMRGLKCQ